MRLWKSSSGLWRVWIPGGSLFLLGGCGLSDAQVASIVQSLISTGVSALVSQLTELLAAAPA